MNGIAVLVTLAAIGVDYGWQPLPDGQLEYVIQIEPTLLDGLKDGEEIVSEIPPQARGVRKFRIRVGTGTVPRIGHLESSTTPRSLPTTSFPSVTNTQGGTSVLPPQNGGGYGAEFAPNGFLNLPPPPALLGPDGMNSVLVRPGSDAIGTSGPPAQVADNPAAPSSSTALNLAPPPAGGGFSEGGWQPPSISGPSNAPPRTGGVYPPSGDLVLPLDDDKATTPSGTPPISPVPSPSRNSETPAPIPFGASGMQPPERTATVSQESVRRDASPDNDGKLLAQLTDATALQKPTIDEETAEQLEAKPWTPLVLTSLALFASLAANLYLGWVAVGIYRRYRDMVDQLHQAQASLT